MTGKHTSTLQESGGNNICRHGNARESEQENTCGDTLNDRGNLESGYKFEDGNAEKDNKNNMDHGFPNEGIGEASGQPVGENCSFNDLQVTWIDGSTSMNQSDDIMVVDRGFLLGDLVALSMDTTGQVGRVMNIDITVDLLAPTGEVVKNVSSRDLRRVREFACGDYVVNGNWLGRVNAVLDDVSVLFDDGSVCKVPKANCSLLKPASKVIAEDPTFPYYPGLRVKATSPSVFKDCMWLSGLWKVNCLEGTVTNVQIGSIFVQWIASAIDLSPVMVPSEVQNPKDLVLLSCFAHTSWRIGDCCLLPQLLAPTLAVDSSATRINEEHIQHRMLKSKILTEDMVGGSLAGHFKSSKGCNDEYIVAANTEHDIAKLDKAVLNRVCKFDEFKSSNLLPKSASHCLSDHYSLDSSPLQKESGTYQTPHANICMLETNEKKRSEPSDACFEAGFCSSSVSVSKQHNFPSSFYQGLQNLILDHEKKKMCQDAENSELVFLITNTRTSVDVIWQDGTRQIGLDSVSLIPVENPGDYELFPEQYVVDASNEGGNASESRRIGIVRSMNSKERTVNIRWLNNPGEFQHLTEEEVASVYELHTHPDYDYCYGDIVTRLPSVSVSTDSTILQNFNEEKSFNSEKGKCDIDKISSLNKGHASDGPFSANGIGLSCFGHITDLKDGNIEVAWGDGEVSKNGPQEIYVVGRETDEEILADESDLSGDDGWEDDAEAMITYGSTGQDYFSPSLNETHIDKDESLPEGSSQSKGGSFSLAVQYVATLASGFLSLGLNEGISSSHMTELHDAEEGKNITDSEPQVASTTATTQARAGTSSTCSELRMDEKLNNNEMAPSMNLEAKNRFDTCELDEFSHFDIAKDPFDHHFLGGSVQQIHCGGKWAKRIQREWTILEKNLPDAVFVKVFEDRIDLLRAVITGACGTPYQDGLFFFDFCFPPEFPQVPPTAYYHSKGLRINPNLYEDGTVCLSLLNTWKGKGNEVWDPSSSSILQVLISLQGLVLNSKPYFNEPGYEKQMGSFEGERNSLSYNENTFLLNLKSMIYIMQNPPMHFEKFVEDHFLKRGPHILNACDAYLKGCPADPLTGNSCCEDERKGQPCSEGFKLILAKLTPKLSLALKESGAKCDELKHLTSS